MVIPEIVVSWLIENDYGIVIAANTVGGGCINHCSRLETIQGETFFLKTNQNSPDDMFSCEAQALIHLSGKGGPRVPKPYLWGRTFLLLEDLKPAPRQINYWKYFGQKLAALHTNTADMFGFEHDNYIGSNPQRNSWIDDGHKFFADQRLLFQAQIAYDHKLLDKGEIRLLEGMIKRLPELVPRQPASLIHGDLWSGNVITGSNGEPAMIDPAVYYGWAEAELAMTALFGGFSQEFYNSYNSTRPLVPGWRNRLEIYNLYHLMNHLNLFGWGYRSQVVNIINKYS